MSTQNEFVNLLPGDPQRGATPMSLVPRQNAVHVGMMEAPKDELLNPHTPNPYMIDYLIKRGVRYTEDYSQAVRGMYVQRQKMMEQVEAMAGDFYVRVLAPLDPRFQNNDALVMTWSEVTFDSAMAQATPYQGTTRILPYKTRHFTGQVGRVGMGMKIEVTAMMTEDGQAVYNAQLQQLAMTVGVAMRVGVMREIMTAGNPIKNASHWNQVYAPNMWSTRTIEDVANQEVDTFFSVAQGSFLSLLTETKDWMVSDLKADAPDTLLIPEKVASFYENTDIETTTYPGSGVPDARLRSNAEMTQRLGGYQTFKISPFVIGEGDKQDFMTDIVALGEFYPVVAPTYMKDYSSACLTIRILDEPNRTMRELTAMDAINNCELFDENGDLIDVYNHPDADPDLMNMPHFKKLHENPDLFEGDCDDPAAPLRPVKFMGSLGDAFMNEDYLSSMSKSVLSFIAEDDLKKYKAALSRIAAVVNKMNRVQLTDADLQKWATGDVPDSWAGCQTFDRISNDAKKFGIDAEMKEWGNFVNEIKNKNKTNPLFSATKKGSFGESADDAFLFNTVFCSNLFAVYELKKPVTASGWAESLLPNPKTKQSLLEESSTEDVADYILAWTVFFLENSGWQTPDFPTEIAKNKVRVFLSKKKQTVNGLLLNSAPLDAIFAELKSVMQTFTNTATPLLNPPPSDEKLASLTAEIEALASNAYDAYFNRARQYETAQNVDSKKTSFVVTAEQAVQLFALQPNNKLKFVPEDPQIYGVPMNTRATDPSMMFTKDANGNTFYNTYIKSNSFLRPLAKSARFGKWSMHASSVGDPVGRVAAYLAISRPFTRDSLKEMIANDMPLPVAWWFVRPDMIRATYSAVLMKAGTKTLVSARKKAVFTEAVDAAVQNYLASYTVHIGTMLIKAVNIAKISNIMPAGTLSGCGVKFRNRKTYDFVEQEYGDGDMFVLLAPVEDVRRIQSNMALDGRFHTYDNRLSNEKLNECDTLYRTAHLYRALWKWGGPGMSQYAAATWYQGMGAEIVPPNTLCRRGFYQQLNTVTGEWVNVPGNSHVGDGWTSDMCAFRNGILSKTFDRNKSIGAVRG